MKDGGRGAGSSSPRDEGPDTSRAGDATPGAPEAERGTDVTDARGGDEAQPPPEGDHEVYHCDLCGSVMLNLHCKLICERCGYKRDCSDP